MVERYIEVTDEYVKQLEQEIDNLEQQCKKQKEVINKITDLIKQYGKYDGEKCKYCDYVSKCSRKCEYNSILCRTQRSFPKVVDKSYEQLQQENKILKENAENNDKVVDKVNWENMLLKKENEQLKDNWNYIKKMLKEARNEEFNIIGYCGTCTDVDIDFLLNKMLELEQGSDNKC